MQKFPPTFRGQIRHGDVLYIMLQESLLFAIQNDEPYQAPHKHPHSTLNKHNFSNIKFLSISCFAVCNVNRGNAKIITKSGLRMFSSYARETVGAC